jgi:WASH complex subunit strumpellin
VKTFIKKLEKFNNKAFELLQEGILSIDFCLTNVDKLLQVIRECNTTVRWLMLHRKTKFLYAYKNIQERVKIKDIMTLLLRTSQLEHTLKGIFEKLILQKQLAWDKDKASAAEKMGELSQYFSGQMALSKVQADEGYQQWFAKLQNQIQGLTFDDRTYAGRKIRKLVIALKDVEQYDII